MEEFRKSFIHATRLCDMKSACSPAQVFGFGHCDKIYGGGAIR